MKKASPLDNAACVLVADDDSTIRIMMREVLETHDFRVIEAKDGITAMEAYEKYNPAILVLDIEMPHKTGLAVCAEIRATTSGKLVPIVISTGLDDIESIDGAYNAGATDFMAKPINWAIFGRRIRYTLRASQAIADHQTVEKRASRLGMIVENSSNEIFIINTASLIIDETNASARHNSGFSSHELINRPFTDLLVDISRSRFFTRINALLTGACSEIVVADSIKRKDNSYYQIEMRLHLFDSEKKSQLVAIVQDISERRAAEERMRYLAFFDALTGLPNRRLFVEELGFLIKMACRGNYLLVVLFIDLDNFKRINDTLGHLLGDVLLRQVAKRLQKCVRESDYIARYTDPDCEITVSRLGGDEFTVVLNNVEEESGAVVAAQRILAALAKPMKLDEHEIVVTPSIGIAVSPTDGKDVESLLKHADTAMYHAKRGGKNNFQFYSSAMNARGLERLKLETELRDAIRQKEFLVYYQPQVDLKEWSIIGAEALVRWQHPRLGIVPPESFIPLAEEMGLIVEIGHLVFHQACKSFAHWVDQGLIEGKIAINLSGLQFNQPDMIERIGEILAETKLGSKHLEVELTESIMMSDAEHTISTLYGLKTMGVSLSIDDFGTGYSSLSYLKRFPLDILKIDRSFVSDLGNDSDSREIVSAIIAMAESLKLNVIAEGVENHTQLAFLKDKGVRTVQGFMFSKPLPTEEFERILKDTNYFDAYKLITASEN